LEHQFSEAYYTISDTNDDVDSEEEGLPIESVEKSFNEHEDSTEDGHKSDEIDDFDLSFEDDISSFESMELSELSDEFFVV